MKFIISLVVLLVGASALPHSSDISELNFSSERLVTDAIASAIEDLSQGIRDAGLDPFYIDREVYRYALPVPVIFNANAHVEELLATGLSNIVIERINFGIITSRLQLTINLPAIEATLQKVDADATVFGSKYEATASGSLRITNIRVATDVRVSVGIISGISISNIDINFTLGGIQSNLNLAIQGVDYSDRVNVFLGETIPNTLREYAAEINELLEILALDIINDLL